MRELSTNERFDQMMVTQSNRDYFKAARTSSLPTHELVNGEWVLVRFITYTKPGELHNFGL